VAKVKFTHALNRFFPELKEMSIEVSSIKELIDEIEHVHTGLKSYILDDQGALRKHVHIFIEEDMINDRKNLTDQISAESSVYIMQALSGG